MTTTKEIAAMQQALEACKRNQSANAQAILEEALAGDNMTPTEQATVKEPVVIFAQYYSDGTCRMQQFSNGITEWYGAEGSLILRSDASNPVVMDYATTVRTKDLTDDEIYKLADDVDWAAGAYLGFARAVIAADREKNK